jgi:sec-independent protein translocase protein TatA
MTLLSILGLGFQELLIIAAVALLFFGGKRIPELMRGMGKGIHSFKEGMKGIEGEEEKKETKSDSEDKKE